MPAGSTSTLLFRELLSKLQIGTLQDKIFSLRGLNSIVAVNEHTSIRLLKTKDFAHIVFQLCRQPDSPKLRTQALKFLKHLASGTVCRKLLLSRGALNDLVRAHDESERASDRPTYRRSRVLTTATHFHSSHSRSASTG